MRITGTLEAGYVDAANELADAPVFRRCTKPVIRVAPYGKSIRLHLDCGGRLHRRDRHTAYSPDHRLYLTVTSRRDFKDGGEYEDNFHVVLSRQEEKPDGEGYGDLKVLWKGDIHECGEDI